MYRGNGISIEDLMELDVMENCNVIAGFRGVRNTISRINIMADPDIVEWTSPGEFLLTTAYFFEKDNVEAQKKLIEECASKNLAGIGIKITPYMDKLSYEVIELANDLSFPIIEIHRSIPLSDVMMDAFREIFDKQASLLERSEKVHEQLMSAMLKGNGLEELTKIIEQNIKNPVILNLKFSGETIEFLGDLEEEISKELKNELRDFYLAKNSKNQLKELIEDKVLINGRYIKRMIMPIILREQIYGHLFFWSTNTPLGGFDLSIIESASTTIALYLLQELSIKEVEIRYRSEYFEDLISVDTRRKNKALDRASFFNFKLDNNYLVEVMSFNSERNKVNENVNIDYIQDSLNPIVTNIEDLMERLDLRGIVSTKGHGVQILLSFLEKTKIKEKVDNFNKEIIKSINNKNRELDVKIGIGRVYENLENVDKSFQDAIRAVRIGKIITDENVITYDELGIFKILCQDLLTEELEDFYDGTLKTLVKYDEKRSTELVKTLNSYFKNNGNLTRVSEELFTHYNTILYRITRITEITGMDLNNPNDRLNLEIATKIKELLEK